MHGGSIEVESELGKGPIFRLRIPLDKAETAATQLRNPDAPEAR